MVRSGIPTKKEKERDRERERERKIEGEFALVKFRGSPQTNVIVAATV